MIGLRAHSEAAEFHALLESCRDLEALELFEGVPGHFIGPQSFTLLGQGIQSVPELCVKCSSIIHCSYKANTASKEIYSYDHQLAYSITI